MTEKTTPIQLRTADSEDCLAERCSPQDVSTSSPSLLESFEDDNALNDNEVFDNFDHEREFDFKISHNFSDSLIQRFNAVLQTANAT